MIPLFRNDSYLAAHDTVVDSVIDDGDYQLLSFRETLFTEGGGQPRDHGSVRYQGEARTVEELVKHKGDIRIRIRSLSDLRKGEIVSCELDFERRFRIMQLHTAQHALAGMLRRERAHYETGGMTIADDLSHCRMTFRSDPLFSDDEIRAAMVRVLDEPRTVRAEILSSVEEVHRHFGQLFRPGDPNVTIRGRVRVVIIDGLDVNACGGTHLRNTEEIGGLELLSLEQRDADQSIYFAISTSDEKRSFDSA